jgi:antitoxin ParD1/3/4
MSNAPIVISLEEESITRYVEARVDSGAYGTPKDFIRDLILDDRDRRLARLEDDLAEAMKGNFTELTDEEWEQGDILTIAEARTEQRG